MNNRLNIRSVLALLMLLCTTSFANDAPWRKPEALFRYHIRPDYSAVPAGRMPTNGYPSAAIVDIYPHETNAPLLKPFMYDGTGNQIACQILSWAPGEPMKIQYDTSGEAQTETPAPVCRYVRLTSTDDRLSLLRCDIQIISGHMNIAAGSKISSDKGSLGTLGSAKGRALKKRQPSWIEIDLGAPHPLDGISVKVPSLSEENLSADRLSVDIALLDEKKNKLRFKDCRFSNTGNAAYNITAETDYYLYLADDPEPPAAWEPQAGITVETRYGNSATTPSTAKAFLACWDSLKSSGNRTPVANIYHASSVNSPSEKIPLEFNQAIYPPITLHRYTGWISIPELAADANILRKAAAELAKARAELEQLKARQRELHQELYEISTNTIPRGKNIKRMRVSQNVAEKKLAEKTNEYKKINPEKLEMVRQNCEFWEKVPSEIKNNEYTFLTTARDSCFVLIDGQLVTAWSADRHLPSKVHRKHLEDLQGGTTALKPGLHKLDFLQTTTSDDCLAVLAWRPLGSLQPQVVSPDMFMAMSKGVVQEIQPRHDERPPLIFDQELLDDLRIDGVNDLPLMAFSITDPIPDARYKWDFGDGRQTEDWLGRTIHCYLQSGLFNVTVQEIPKNERDGVRTASRLVSAHIIWGKTRPANETRILNTLLKDDLSKADIGHLMNGCCLAQQLKKEQSNKLNLKETFRTPLLNRVREYRPEDAVGALHLAGDCKNFELRNYEKSLEIYNQLIRILPAQAPLRAEALIEGAEILINCYGQDDAGLALLDQLSNAPLDRDQTIRAGLLRAATMMPQQPTDKILALIRTITPLLDARNELLTGIHSLGNIRHARMLVTEYPDDPAQLTFAMEKIDQLIIQNPAYYILPELNLIKLDIYLNRMEYERANQLSQRLLHLELSESVRPEIIARQIRALYGLNRKDQALELIKTLTEQYPYSPATAAVKKLQKKK